jgi:hypothetical protein
MQRRSFINNSLKGLALAGMSSCVSETNQKQIKNTQKAELMPGKAYAITMWDFSWVERRWPGAGYEDWDLALDELVERGYNAVRIDAFPHFVANDPETQRTLIPVWNQEDWGSPAKNRISILPDLIGFIPKCKERNIKVGLSSWFREDENQLRMNIRNPRIMAEWWVETIRVIEEAGLLDTILYVDLCNEWPGIFWAPYFENEPPELTWGGWFTEKSIAWMKESAELFKLSYPHLPLTYSFDANESKLRTRDISYLDFLEPHIWMVHQNGNEFYNSIGYADSPFSTEAYETTVKFADPKYRESPSHWKEILVKKISDVAEVSRELNLPLMTTECWAIVNYKDWPLLSWDWVKELCAVGVKTAAETGRWSAIATSNFCGPQFKGMWRDIEWHQRLTKIIKEAPLEKGLRNSF